MAKLASTVTTAIPRQPYQIADVFLWADVHIRTMSVKVCGEAISAVLGFQTRTSACALGLVVMARGSAGHAGTNRGHAPPLILITA